MTKMTKENAEEFTQSLGQIFTGSYRLIFTADRLGVPRALGLSLNDWVQKRLGGYVRMSIEERRAAVVDLAADGASNRKIAAVLGVGETTVRRDLEGTAPNGASEENPATENHGNGEADAPNGAPTPAAKAARTRTAHEEIAKFAFDQPAVYVPEGDPVRLGDFYDLSTELKNDSVDLIFTDPPYDDKSIPLFSKMREVAARILKPGGSLITYLGHMQLIEAGKRLSEFNQLRYWHPLCCLHAGPTARMTEFGVIETFKPMLWFVKGTRGDKQTFIESSISGSREKDHHEWQQAESEAAYFIERLTPPGGLVVDFFAGGGTTIVAAHKLNRHSIGYEIDAKHHRKANDRIKMAGSEMVA